MQQSPQGIKDMIPTEEFAQKARAIGFATVLRQAAPLIALGTRGNQGTFSITAMP